MKRPMLIAYDISDAKRLYRALKILKRWRLDGQKSVHECLLTQKEAIQLKQQLTAILHSHEDKLLMVWLDGRRPIQVRGTGKGLGIFKKIFYIK
ncbi:MAG TPA: CRISPR-associated endonuclease Cas2 [Piscirickettsiaceae bacterium]|nr:CRISPR-associated endonuclease Cas2 [Piscirickettsiaceae bacterium]HIQ39962.1 CRISPR-associated endonuclease Cas2 [Sulfurivirga caldicuralii]